ncbi:MULTISPECIES: hypothetical protein [Priestia]|uniref:Uncharacterized protein n=1 Tax=Priestia megaterium TaxID=1404 RepID=A0AAX6BMV0_PRIMG|nr:hypothetical protein [Priestia megaterium]AWD68342.1 hypothetical protein C2I28_25880 [Priestia megaterium]GMG75111.1 hypothetical protein ShirakiTB12_35790 [Priestia megaterium]
MLQIVTGKFFTKERYDSEASGKLYSNFKYGGEIKLCHGQLAKEPSVNHSNINTYIYSYKSGLEKKDGPGLIQVGTNEVLEQLSLICSFTLKSYFSKDQEKLETQTINSNNFIPSRFLKGYFENEIIGTGEDIKFLIENVYQILSLPRETYKVIIKCLDRLVESIRTVKYDINAAYSMLVYALETLSQSFDNFTPTWEDYDQKVRRKLDKVFKDLKVEQSTALKDVLLDSAHLKLQKRFITFITQHLTQDFFTTNAQGLKRALKKSDLVQTLNNAYSIRSGYVHQLVPMMNQLTIPLESETVQWGNQPYLTYNGLFRLTYNVIQSFINNHENLGHEEWNWEDDLPGMMYVNLAPEYWVHKADNFIPEVCKQRLEGLLSIISTASFYGKEQGIPSVDNLLSKIEELLPQAKKQDKLPMFIIYMIYNDIMEDEKRLKYERVYKTHQSLLTECNIMTLTYSLLFEEESWTWNLEECVKVYSQYEKRRYNDKAFLLPSFIEIMMVLEIGNCYFDQGDYINYRKYLEKGILDLAGSKELQDFLSDSLLSNSKVDLNEFINLNRKLSNFI